jgi:hypothetical protein
MVPLCVHNSLRNAADQVFDEYRESGRYQKAIPQHGLNGCVWSVSGLRGTRNADTWDVKNPKDRHRCYETANREGDSQEQRWAFNCDRPKMAVRNRHYQDEHKYRDRSCEDEEHAGIPDLVDEVAGRATARKWRRRCAPRRGVHS